MVANLQCCFNPGSICGDHGFPNRSSRWQLDNLSKSCRTNSFVTDSWCKNASRLNESADRPLQLIFLFSMFLLQTAAWSQSGASKSSKTQKCLEMDLPKKLVNVDQWWIDASIVYQLQSCLFSDSFAKPQPIFSHAEGEVSIDRWVGTLISWCLNVALSPSFSGERLVIFC